METAELNAERQRLERQHEGRENWRLWGPYLAERAWGTVREDYSEYGSAWEYFDHEQARSRAYRWNEDGLGGICDDQQRLCLSLALWNGHDPILKERAFGLTGNQGNHGEDVKEYYFYLDATPSHSYLRYLYKYPQVEYPYARLVEENRRRGRLDPPCSLLDTGAFHENRYWDVEVHYAKRSPTEIHANLIAYNSGPEEATLHLLPTLLFRNTWAWGDVEVEKPLLKAIAPPRGAAWAVQSSHPTLGTYYLYGRQPATVLYTGNETNTERLWGCPNTTPWVKDAFHRYVVESEHEAVNPALEGTRFAAWHQYRVAPGHNAVVNLVLSDRPLEEPFARSHVTFSQRRSEADIFYDDLLPDANPEDHRIMRQALAGMIWSKQFFHYDVSRWLAGDRLPPPTTRRYGRNRYWKHFRAGDVISMPDKWEYPWFAAWDLAFHCAALALVDIDFAKDQIELMVKENYLHPNGQIPAYEWALGDVNPPVHAMGALKAYRSERVQRGCADRDFLLRVFNKLLLNYAWWINRKDTEGHNVFEGGFLGLDNISVFDRSNPMPPGYSLKQADATGWMAMFALNMTLIALELAYDELRLRRHRHPDLRAVPRHRQHRCRPCRRRHLAVGSGGGLLQGPGHHAGREQPPHRRLFMGRADPAVRLRGRGPAAALQGASICKAAEPAQGWVVPGPLHLCLPGMGERARRTPAVTGGSHHAAAHPAAAAQRERIPLLLRRAQRQQAARHAARARPPAGRGHGDDRVCPGRIELGAVRRQFQLARTDLDADQFPAGAVAGEVLPLPRRRVHRGRALPGRPQAESEGDRKPHRRTPGGHLPARRDRAGARPSAGEPVPARPLLARPASVLRVLPRRHRSGAGRIAPDRMDRTPGQPGRTPLPQRHPTLLARAGTGGTDRGDCSR